MFGVLCSCSDYPLIYCSFYAVSSCLLVFICSLQMVSDEQFRPCLVLVSLFSVRSTTLQNCPSRHDHAAWMSVLGIQDCLQLFRYDALHSYSIDHCINRSYAQWYSSWQQDLLRGAMGQVLNGCVLLTQRMDFVISAGILALSTIDSYYCLFQPRCYDFYCCLAT